MYVGAGAGRGRTPPATVTRGGIKKERIEGEGTWIDADGSQYMGSFRGGVRGGYGTHLKGTSEEIFQGEVEDGEGRQREAHENNGKLV